MNTSDTLFPDETPGIAKRTLRQGVRKRILRERERYPLEQQAWSEDPVQADAAMERLKARILKAVPPGTPYLEALMKISRFEWSRRIETAGISCSDTPVLLLNPAFLDRHCVLHTDLRMLILHELHHILYGHHILCGDVTPAKNVAFDAVVNARLCRIWREPAHADFFRGLYGDAGFPAMLLCPAPGWPCESGTPEKDLVERLLREGMDPQNAARAVDLRCRLYEPGSGVGYEEVLELLTESGVATPPLLLGNHMPHQDGQPDMESDGGFFLLETARAVNGLLDKLEHRNGGCQPGRGCDFFSAEFAETNPRAPFLEALRRVLVKAGICRRGHSARYIRGRTATERESLTVIPDWRDRTVHAREALFGAPPLLYKHRGDASRIGWRPVTEAHVYLDVSGSMFGDLPWITAALRPLEHSGLCRIFLFSTKVAPLPKGTIGRDALASTGGTDIACVLNHLLELPPPAQPRKALVLTDGYFSLRNRRPGLVKAFSNSGIALHGAVTCTGSLEPLSSIAASVTRLPAYQ